MKVLFHLLSVFNIKNTVIIKELPNSGRAGSQWLAPNDSYHANIQRGNLASAGPSGRRPPFMSRNSEPNHRPSLDTVSRGRSVGRSYGNQNINRYQQGTTSNPKGNIDTDAYLMCFVTSKQQNLCLNLYGKSVKASGLPHL